MAGISVGGIVSIKSAKQLQAESRQQADLVQQQPIMQALAAHVTECWTLARTAKMQTVEQRMFRSLRQRRGEYDPDKLAEIREQGGSEIYMMVTSTKCRGAASWMRDVLLGSAGDKPWTLKPSPIPDLPPDKLQEIMQQAQQMIQGAMQAGTPPNDGQVRDLLGGMKKAAESQMQDEAAEMVERMELKMEDQLVEGGWIDAINSFIDDLVTFPTAFLKGPVVRKRKRMQWIKAPQGWTIDTQDKLVLEVERVDPFNIYPHPAMSDTDDFLPLIERHRMYRADFQALIGVEGYDEQAIRGVLEDYGTGGLHEWLNADVQKAMAEGKSTTALTPGGQNQEIDALQFWGPVQGKMLLEWGMDEAEVPDPLLEYHCEVWLVGKWVIKATLNYHPEGKKPYYGSSWESVPGAFWGNSVPDLVRDTQMMCNAAARALANNMGLASGPQVIYNIDRLPSGEDLTQMYPWKVWQVSSDPYAGSAPPVSFFQPGSQAQELMQVYDRFALLADEHSNIPRYMTGDSPGGGAGRTASGMSMLMSNAGKSIKQVIAHIDVGVIKPLLERLYFYNMKYSDDEELKGDINVVARGALSILTKENAQIRRNEFLVNTANPIDMQIVGVQGRAAILRETAKTLDMNPDDIVPDKDQLQRNMAQQQQQQTAAQQAAAGQPRPQAPNVQNKQVLQNGAPVTDHFAPTQ